MTTPEIRFACASRSTIAYMVYGDGPATVCAVPPMAQNVELAWNSPHITKMFERFAAFSRQVAFDKRGTGMSDRSLDIPGLDERVDELKAVMDHAEIDRAYIHGVSEGGPMAIMYAATYPDRVEGLILEGTGATMLSDDDREIRRTTERSDMFRSFVDGWGTPDSITLQVFAPTLADDPDFSSWWPTYERQAASRDALETLMDLIAEMDAREAIPRVECPVLIVHRTDDQATPVARGRETYELFCEAGAEVEMVEVEGRDHFSYAGDLEPIAAAIERFTTGTVRERAPVKTDRIEVRSLGAFEVLDGGEPVPTSEWGSKRARTLLKRLVAADGWPVTRDELIELLWPDEMSDRLNARLSVQLSAVRRVLRGGVVADRAAVRLDLDAIDVDVIAWKRLDDDAAIVDQYHGDFLPDDRFDDWTAPVREALRARFVEAAHRELERAEDDGDVGRVAGVARRLLAGDRYDEQAHRALVRALHGAGRHGEARAAYDTYTAAMTDLAVTPAPFDTLA